MAYTELQPGQTPTLGTKGQGVAQYQAQLNAQNQGKSGWEPLVVDGIFGQKTQAASNFGKSNPLIVTGTNPANQFNQDTQSLNNMLAQINPQANQNANQQLNPQPQQQIPGNPGMQSEAQMAQSYSDPYTQMLDKISATSDKATQNLIATIKSNKAAREQNVNLEYDRLKQGLMSLGLSTDRMQYTPDLVYGGITQAENARMGQLQKLDQDEATALLEAQQARENKDFTLLKDKIAYLKDIKNQRLERLKNSFDTMNYEAKIGELQAKQVYDQLQKIPQAKRTEYLQAIATRLGIPLLAITSQIQNIARSRASKKGGSKTIASTTKNAYTAVNIPADVKSNLIDDLRDKNNTIDDIIRAYPDVSSSYISSLKSTLK